MRRIFHSLWGSRWAQWAACLALCASALCVSAAHAHELPNNTARVQLRNNHCLILLNVGLLDWLALLGDEPSDGAPSFDEAQISERLERARSYLITHTILTVDGENAPIRILRFPTTADVLDLMRQFAEIRVKGGHLSHGFGRYLIQLESDPIDAEPGGVLLSFHPSLGAMPVSLEMPQPAFTQPGAIATVRLGPVTTSTSDAEQSDDWSYLALACGIAFLFMLPVVLLRRKDPSNT